VPVGAVITWGCVAEAIVGCPVLSWGSAAIESIEIFASKPSDLHQGLQPFEPPDDPISPQ
jgi:hypothetical protein